MIKLAIFGGIRAGKTTAAYFLQDNYSLGKVSFGTSLKRYADLLFPEEALKGKPRKLYQEFGEKCREVDENVFIKHAAKDIEKLTKLSHIKGIVIDDLRQPNEYEWLKENGYTFIKIKTKEDTRLSRAEAVGDNFTKDDMNHPVENFIYNFKADYVIDNNGNYQDLTKQIDEIMQEIKKGDK